jgi:hypothetical protein
MTTDVELLPAFRAAVDPGTRHRDFEAALATLVQSPAYLRTLLTEHHARVFRDLAPDRLFELSALLPPVEAALEDPLAAASLAGFLHEQQAASTDPGLLATRRAQAFALVLARLGRFSQIPPEGVAWLFWIEHDWMDQDLYVELEKWCLARAQIPDTIVQLVATLREDERDSPPLDRVAVLVAADEQCLVALAREERATRRQDEAWRLAAQRWVSEGHAPHNDPLVKAPSTIDEAVRLHGRLTVAYALHRAAEAVEHPIFRILLSAWEHQVRNAP